MTVYKVEADYDPDNYGSRTEAGTNGIEHYVEDRELAEQIAEEYVLESQMQNNVEWIETSSGTYELAAIGRRRPMGNVHARIDEIEIETSLPQFWSADDRRDALAEANANR